MNVFVASVQVLMVNPLPLTGTHGSMHGMRQLVVEDQIYHTATLQMLKLEDWKGPQERFKSIFL